MAKPRPEFSYAPWTDEEVKSLNDYQVSGLFHEFTCGNQDHKVRVALRATRDGWVCPECDYTQNWAWNWMADGAWKAQYEIRKNWGTTA